MKRIILRALLFFIVLVVAYLMAWPVPINPSAWTPPAAPDLTGSYAQNSELAKIQRLSVNSFAPEDVAFDNQDRIYSGTDDGIIYRLQSPATNPQLFAQPKRSP